MADTNITAGVEQFVIKHIDTSEQVEVLLQLHTAPERAWSVDAIYQKVLTSRESVARQLDLLCARGLAEARGEPKVYLYRPQAPELDAAVKGLAGAYRLAPHRIIELIYSKPSSAIRSFADAFRLRKD